jgi:FkbM family methyltransferase
MLIFCLLLGFSLSLSILLALMIATTQHLWLPIGFVSGLLVLCGITAFQYRFSSLRTIWLWFWYRRTLFWLFTIAGRNPLCDSRDEANLYAEAAKYYRMYGTLGKSIRLLETDREGRMLWGTPLGTLWIPKGATREWLIALIAEQLQNVYTYEEEFGTEGAVVFDCGANVGDFSRLALSKGASLVVAIEPSPETAVCLRRNLAEAIAGGRVIVYENGVWDCEVKLYLETANAEVPGSHRVVASPDLAKQGAWVELTTIDSIVGELNLERLDFIKMDVEGAEQKALLGGARTITRHRPKLAIATEHTDDRLANSGGVLRIIKKIEPAYASRSVSCAIVSSPSAGYLIVPEIIVCEAH